MVEISKQLETLQSNYDQLELLKQEQEQQNQIKLENANLEKAS